MAGLGTLIREGWRAARGTGATMGAATEAPGVGRFLQEGLIGSTVGNAVRNPGWGIPALGLGGMFGKDFMWDPMVDALEEDPYQKMVRDSRARGEAHKQSLVTRMEYEELQKRMARASMRLAASDPHLYNEIMAGRSLPKDAVVFGGQPRTDLMEELSMAMAQGQFQEPQSAQDELMKSLGV